MKNIIKSFTLLLLISLSITSCLIDDDNLTDKFNDGQNFASFSNLTQTVSAVANGNNVTTNVSLELQGPTIHNMTEDVTVSVSVDPTSTAIEGVHFNLNETSFTLKASNNYISVMPITIITEGIVPPLAVAPTITLLISDISGNNVFANSKKITLSLIYQCFADMSGTYLVTNDGCNMTPFLTTITQNSDGSWFVAIGDGGFLGFGCTGNPGLNNWANIVELCGEILPTGDLEFGSGGCCGIGDITSGTWNSDSGVLTLNHVQSFTPNWAGSWTSTYTRQ